MFGQKFEMNEHTMPVIEGIGRHMPGGFFIYKAGGDEEILYANHAVVRIFGCDDLDDFKRLTGYTFRGMLHPDDYKAISESIDKQITGNDENMDYVKYRIIRKDGSVRWVDDFGHYTETEAYGGIYYVFISDITDKVLEEDSRHRISFVQRELIDRSAGFDVIEGITADDHFLHLFDRFREGE